MPATRAALYGIKPTIGIVSVDGVIPISPIADAPGPMAKSAYDIAVLLDILVDSSKTSIPPGGYTTALSKSWANIRVGTLDPKVWEYPATVVTPNIYATAQMVGACLAHYQDSYLLLHSEQRFMLHMLGSSN